MIMELCMPKLTIRQSVFETNSSSVHAVSVMPIGDYDDFVNGDVAFQALDDGCIEPIDIGYARREYDDFCDGRFASMVERGIADDDEVGNVFANATGIVFADILDGNYNRLSAYGRNGREVSVTCEQNAGDECTVTIMSYD